jgi:crotonobetainyl-CoA:carnitine CoA-transferase CaiB-like acyl-CoA transferase
MAPETGQHNDAVYGGLLGYSDAHIAELRSRGVI